MRKSLLDPLSKLGSGVGPFEFFRWRIHAE